MSLVIAWFEALILLSVAVLNLYWASGGGFGKSAVIPEVNGKPLFRPSRAGKYVAALLFAAAALLAWSSIYHWLSPTLLIVGHVAMASVFLVRAVGEFRTFGAFKSIRGTHFAKWDNRLYIPISLMIVLSSLFLAGHAILTRS